MNLMANICVIIRTDSYRVVENYLTNLKYVLKQKNIDLVVKTTTSYDTYVNCVEDLHLTNSIIIFIGYRPILDRQLGNTVYVLNFDQFSLKYSKNIDPSMAQRINIFEKTFVEDYLICWCNENMNIIRQSHACRHIHHLPYMYAPIDRILTQSYIPSKDVCFVGSLSPHRQEVLKHLSDHQINITVLSNEYGHDRDLILTQHKILVDIGYFEQNVILTSIRCNPCLFRGLIVITTCDIIDHTQPINKLIIHVTMDQLVDKIKLVLSEYDTFHREYMLLQDKCLQQQTVYQNECVDKFISDLNSE